ncbi:hydrogenase maturation nickel metallochaperone HypA [Maridesulfovibrio ferrireducens]|uniref:hydrogenase maturation nickel metallochaperone HypA/HybF n=1 Tax=Maridesulfovibrio ferrireducens TaxID=246191 RepID=UPI001A1BE2F1|nr:hydrogenase maturation nickel metallochaperone HypA [Maridesulfovibrio ferrireducens]MBI9109668.1 hydrogenase maturation nickel metallochaperone HypA [Maridesulfovibrio ferrireducens]
MHEMSIAQSIHTIVLEELEKHPDATLKKVLVNNGALAGIVSEALTFGWEAITMDTPLQGSILVVNEIPIIVSCGSCQKEFTPNDRLYMPCPDCGLEIGHKVLQGKELQIEGIEIE